MAASPLCMRCFKRSLLQLEPPASSHTRAFSTTVSLAATPVKKKSSGGRPPPAKASKTLRLSKKKRVAAGGRPPARGERKALSQRIVLSNTNALEVPLQDLTAQTVRDIAHDEAHMGKMLGLSGETVDALRALEAFKHTQGWNLFRRPATLVRRETRELAAKLESATQGETTRLLLHGEKGAGKSVLLLQGMAMAWLKGWIVIHFPEAKDLTNAHTSYAPITIDGNFRYIQPHYTSRLLGNVLKANFNLLSAMRLSRELTDFEIPIQPNISLARFAEIGAKDVELAWPVWSVLWEELTSQSQEAGEGLQRPPIYISMDGLDHVMRDSAYLDTNNQQIHAHDLTLVEQYMGVLVGEQLLTNGGVVVAAVSESNRAATPTLDYHLGRFAADRVVDLQEHNLRAGLEKLEAMRDSVSNVLERREREHRGALASKAEPGTQSDETSPKTTEHNLGAELAQTGQSNDEARTATPATDDGTDEQSNGEIEDAVDEKYQRKVLKDFYRPLEREMALLTKTVSKMKEDLPTWDAYLHIDEKVDAVLSRTLADGKPAMDMKEVKGLAKEEARGVMEYYAQSGLMRASITDSLVSEKWTVSGGGILGQLEKSTVRMSF